MAQVDWIEDMRVILAGKLSKVQVLNLVLNYSGVVYCEAFLNARQEAFFQGHRNAFEFWGGVPTTLTYDNLKSAVTTILEGRNREENERFVAFRSAYLFESRFCNPARGNEKGRVENMVKFVQRNFFTPIPQVASLEELNQRLRQGCEAYLKQTQSRQVESIETRFKSEQPHFLPLPLPPECCRIIPVKVSKTSLVQFETNRYSVPSEYAHQTVWLKAFVGHLEITIGDKTVASHSMASMKSRFVLTITLGCWSVNPELNSILKAGKPLPLSLWFLNRRVTPKSVSNLQTLPNTANYSGVFTMIQPQALLLETNLKKLRLPNILKQYRKLASHAAEGNLTHEQFLHLLLDQEVQTREKNTLKQRIRQARFPAEKTLSGFEFTAMPNLNKPLLLDLLLKI